MFNAMWGRRKLGQPSVGNDGLSTKVDFIGKSVKLMLRCDDEVLMHRSD
jgi:hypothetical protein